MLKYRCPAKINLFLKVLGRSETGYHHLESLFAFLDLHDDLEVSVSDKFLLEIDGEFSRGISLQHNLITEILDFFAGEFPQVSRNLKIKLTKNIPVGAGLGGGSSDAAYFMMALDKIFSLGLSAAQLQKISFNFGSDIAFFFADQASIIKDRGEVVGIYPDFSPLDILLVNPKIHLSTKDVFAALTQDKNYKFSPEIPTAQLQKTALFDLLKDFSNDLTNPAISIVPAISQILEEMKNDGAQIAKMSGSGASCFAIFSDAKNLENAHQKMIKKFPDFFVIKTKILHQTHD